MNELIILFKAKKFEIDINDNIFFFEYFLKDNPKWNKLFQKKDYHKENENDFNHIKNGLKLLKNNGIYDYELIKPYKQYLHVYMKKMILIFNLKSNKWY